MIEVAHSRRRASATSSGLGKALAPSRLVGSAPIRSIPSRAYVNGGALPRAPGAIVLRQHAEIVLEARSVHSPARGVPLPEGAVDGPPRPSRLRRRRHFRGRSPYGGCGSSSSGIATPTVSAARTYELAGFEPATPARAGKPTTVAFTIRQPSGKPLVAFKRGSGPHTGVHLIIVRDDLAYIIHRHPPIASDGRISERVTFPAPGEYRVVVDAYPRSRPAAQLPALPEPHRRGAVRAPGAPPFSSTVTSDATASHSTGGLG